MKDKLRVGIIGAGAVVREIYQHLYFHSRYSSMLEICSVADPDPQSLKWFADLAKLPESARFHDYRKMIAGVQLDAVQVNTPDHRHCEPTVAALKAGLDVVLPKPMAATVKDAHAMLSTAQEAGRFLGVDFHKREDPRIKEAASRFQRGRYGLFQSAVFYMLDKVFVADPNHTPRFFATPDYAEKNTPVSFLTVHMADALMQIVRLIPLQVRAIGYSHKLPSLKPQPIKGYDLVDTEILFESGAVAHILTGWALPNTAWSNTVQSARLICSGGMLDLGIDSPGLTEIHPEGLVQLNPLFRNFERDGSVTGYGIRSPGRLYEQVLALRNGTLLPEGLAAALDPMTVGFYTTLVLEGAERSLRQGREFSAGAIVGAAVDLRRLITAELGEAEAKRFFG